MGRYAMVIKDTGLYNGVEREKGEIDNVIVYDGVSPFNPPTGIELVEDKGDGVPAEPGGTWNGSAFVRAPIVEPTRTQVLMSEVTEPQKYDEDAVSEENPSGWRDKTADEIAAEKLELKNLLLAELDAGDLSQDRTQMLLRLERE